MKYLFTLSVILFTLNACTNRITTDNQESDALLRKAPNCIKQKIAQFKKDPVTNPPKKVYQYTYHDSTVYYITAECCDMYSELFDSKCNIMGHPDGGFTGKGDGKVPDFSTAATNQQLIWEDNRK